MVIEFDSVESWKFDHNFTKLMFPANDRIEDTGLFLLLCPSFDAQKKNLSLGYLLD